MATPRITGLLESAIYVDDMARACGFYRDVLGLMVMLDTPRLTAFDAGAGGVGYFAHLGGLGAGWLYLRVAGLNQPASAWRSRVETAPDLSDDPPRAIPRTGPKPRESRTEADDVLAKSKALFGAVRRPMASPRDAVRREALDRVLDKIARHGMASLTPDERTLLDDESRRLREPD